jgi:hypothetical protein
MRSDNVESSIIVHHTDTNVVLIVPAFPGGVKAIGTRDSDEMYHVDEMQRWAVRCSIICDENGPLLLEQCYFEGLNSLWNRAKSKKVGDH